MEYGFVRKESGGVPFYCVPRFLEAGGLAHGFTTRAGGVSEGAFATLNVGLRRADKKENIMENLRRATEAVGGTFSHLVISHQVHGTVIRHVTERDAGEGARGELNTPECDALMTDTPGIPLLTGYADCVPVALYDPKRKVIAAVHAGWRGTADRIAYHSVKEMCAYYGSDPADILAGIGASIGKCCFEIDRDVADEFPAEYVEKSTQKEGKFYADLWRYNADQLKEAGVLDQNITLAGVCTVCRNDIYFSSRAQQKKMGNHGLIMELTK